MVFKRTKLHSALALAFGGGLMLAATPSLAQQPQTLERVEITGSAIKRVQAEGPAPVEVYSRKDIERTGATTITELVKNIASLDIDDQGDLTGNSPSGSGTTNLQIRGLSERNLLVLLNGRRLAVNALHDGSGAGAAVDVNSIPIGAIERIEVLKDGGSAIYGADAVAGVINFITRKNYSGLEARIGYGVSSRSDAKETPIGVVAGFGDFDTQGFNVLAALDYFKRDALKRKDRDISVSANWSRFANGTGRDGRSVFHPSANIYNNSSGTVTQLAPCPPGDLDGVGQCRFDFSKGDILDLTNPAQRTTGMLIGNVKLGSSLRAFAEVTYSKSEDRFLAQPAPEIFSPDRNGDGDPDDLDGDGLPDEEWAIRIMQAGPRTTDRKSTLLQSVVGLEGAFRGIDWDVALGQSTSKVANYDTNYLASDLTFAALNRFATGAPNGLDPSSVNNPSSLMDSLRLSPVREGKSKLTFLNGKLSGTLAELGGGPLQYALGGTFNRETLSDRPDANQQAGNVFGSIQQSAVDAERDLKALFAELSIPVIKGVEIQAAVRRDQYSGLSALIAGNRQSFNGSSKTSPKLAIKYQPSGAFAVRASYAESFLAPSLKQLFGGAEQGAESIDCLTEPTNPVCVAFNNDTNSNFPYSEISGSNPNLKPETGKTLNIGLIFEPFPSVGVSVDFFRIKKKDEINTLSVESAAARGDVGRDPVSGAALVFVNNQNVAAAKIEGFDLDVRWRVGDTPLGRMNLRNALTYYTKNQKQFEPGGEFFEYNASFLFPRWRNALSADFERGPWTTTMRLRSTSAMRDSDQPSGTAENRTRRMIAAYEEFDVGVQYAGIKNLTLGAMVKNLFDRQVPYSTEGTQNQYGSLGFPWIYSPRGRYFNFTANYKFF